MTRNFYNCPRSGTWALVREERKVCVRNVAPDESGGRETDYELVSFLALFHQSPQARSLVELIGILVETPDN